MVEMSRGEVRPTGYVGLAQGSPANPGPPYLSTLLPAPCRNCHGPSWLADELGAVHPCCQMHGAGECPSCRASEMLNREQRRRHGKRSFNWPV